jgi:hypothetical protein
MVRKGKEHWTARAAGDAPELRLATREKEEVAITT